MYKLCVFVYDENSANFIVEKKNEAVGLCIEIIIADAHKNIYQQRDEMLKKYIFNTVSFRRSFRISRGRSGRPPPDLSQKVAIKWVVTFGRTPHAYLCHTSSVQCETLLKGTRRIREKGVVFTVPRAPLLCVLFATRRRGQIKTKGCVNNIAKRGNHRLCSRVPPPPLPYVTTMLVFFLFCWQLFISFFPRLNVYYNNRRS